MNSHAAVPDVAVNSTAAAGRKATKKDRKAMDMDNLKREVEMVSGS